MRIKEGCLVLGQCQRIVFAELDGPRPRSLRMQFMGEGIAHELVGWGNQEGWGSHLRD